MSFARSEAIILRPRPLERYSGYLILLPLLPYRPPVKPLPLEVWSKILDYVIGPNNADSRSGNGGSLSAMNYVLVCKAFKGLALPLIYAQISLRSIGSLQKLTQHLQASEQKWDSLRRIRYSTPGRWVQWLNISALVCNTRTDECLFDALLTDLFVLVPFLARLELGPSNKLSRRAFAALAFREGAEKLQVLKGVKYDAVSLMRIQSDSSLSEDPITQLVGCCSDLRELEVIGPGLQESDATAILYSLPLIPRVSLDLPHLHTLSLLSTPTSPLLLALMHVDLPSLHTLVITPYHDISYPSSLVSEFIERHGPSLRTLLLCTTKSWPTTLHPTPPSLLQTCPNLTHLSLERPLPDLSPPLSFPSCDSPHPLRVLSIPRPDPTFLATIDRLLPSLPSLKAIRMRDARWLRHGMTLHAQEAGMQGEMRAWQRRLGSRGVEIYDQDWKPMPT